MPNLPCFYSPPPGLANGHVQTLFPTLFRRDIPLKQHRTRIASGEDFLELDISVPDLGGRETGRGGGGEEFLTSGCREAASRGVVIISHGLEGDSRRKYVKGMAKAFNAVGCDAIAWNQPGCGGGLCLTPRIYHMGETRDLRCVINYAREVGYTRIGLVGFSMGGNQILRFAGESEEAIPTAVKGIAVFSVPCDLTGSVNMLNKRGNHIYMRYFMRSLHPKVRGLHQRFPGSLGSIDGLSKIFTFSEFDDRFTAPLNGFASATDYYARTSALPLLERINIPTLLVNAGDDPFLSPECYPYAAAEGNPKLSLKVPDSGGHVGFVTFNKQNLYWSERAACDFLMPLLSAA